MKQTNSLIFTSKRVACLILLAGSCLLAPAQADDVYKWVNENNETQYTQMPPPHGITAIRIQSATPRDYAEDSDTPEPEQTASESVDDEFPEAGQGDGTEDSSDRDAEVARSMQENCNNARKNLESLNRGQVRYVNPAGEVVRLTEEERQQRIEEANTQIKLLCK